MENQDLIKEVTARAQVWLGDAYDEETRAEVRRMLASEDKTELIDSFYRDLEFGTGGLRGIMGAGTNRMNIYTVHPVSIFTIDKRNRDIIIHSIDHLIIKIIKITAPVPFIRMSAEQPAHRSVFTHLSIIQKIMWKHFRNPICFTKK